MAASPEAGSCLVRIETTPCIQNCTIPITHASRPIIPITKAHRPRLRIRGAFARNRMLESVVT